MPRRRITRRHTLQVFALAAMAASSPLHAIDEFWLDSDDVKDGRLGPAQVAGREQGLGCQGGNVSPHLSWDGVPPGTESFAVTMRDLNAPPGSRQLHWAIMNIPAGVRELARGAGAPGAPLPAGAQPARTDFGAPGYVGPCPPAGQRRNYIFTLTALSVARLDVDAGAPPAAILGLLDAHRVNSASFVVNQGR
jgi:hypothetical protein